MSLIRTLSHEQARQALQMASDGRLDSSLQRRLEAHLAGCPDCLRFAEQLSQLEAHLSAELPLGWLESQPSERQIAGTLDEIQRHARKKTMRSIFSNTARTAALGLGAILLVAALVWGIRSLLPKPLPAAAETETPTDTIPIVTQEVSISAIDTPIPTEAELRVPQPVLPSGAPSLFPNTIFDFPSGFPDAAQSVNLYRLLLPSAVTADSARQMAARLGVEGGVYSFPGEGFDQILYEVTDGSSLVRFLNFAEQFVFETGYADPLYRGGEPLPYEEQLRIATEFLNRYDLLDQPYAAAPSAIEQSVVRFTPLIEDRPVMYGNGQNPGNMEWISVQVNADGQVSQVMYSQQDWEQVGEYPILSAVQAWERLSAPNAEQRTQYAVMLASQPNTYRLWRRPYPTNQPVDLFGYVQVYQPGFAGDPLIVTFNNYPVSGGESLEAVNNGAYIHAWGQFVEDGNGHQVFNLDNWEISNLNEEYLQGTIQWQDGQGQLVTDSGTLKMPDLPADIPEGYQAYATGIRTAGDPATINWFQLVGGEYPVAYYTSRSCGGGGGGGGGGSENANFGGGVFARLNLDLNLVLSPTVTPLPAPYNTGDMLDGLTGQVNYTTHLYSDGTTTTEVNLWTAATDTAPNGAYFRLEGTSLDGIEAYQNLPLRIWGQVTGEENGTYMVNVDRYEPQYPGVIIQQWNGTESIVNLEGQDVVLLAADSGEAFVLQSSLTWGAEGNIIGVLGNLIEIEGYVIPDRQFGGYPVIQDMSGGIPPDMEVTSDDLFIQDHSYDTPGQTIWMEGHVTIDSIELAYASITMENCLSSHADNPDVIPSLIVQPVWVFTGHFDDGRLIVIQVQALPDEYLQ